MARRSRILLEPIGFVHTKDEGLEAGHPGPVSKLVLSEKYANGLEGVDGYSHIFVIYWLHKVRKSERRHLLTYPDHDPRWVGVFSTRHPNRPNPIGLTVVQLLQRRSNVLKVRGLDAFDGTPILDIKPYNHRDIPEKIHEPD
jgi:tRNA-Thr(GGU) m(6)t(6)A37 methyltransferase TsaA